MNQGLELHGLQGIWSAQGLGWAWGLVETLFSGTENFLNGDGLP